MSSDVEQGAAGHPDTGTVSAQRSVACPGCGQPATVSMNRRVAADFCPRCDYPLFWTPSEVIVDPRSSGESLRRLPGAVGQQRVGSVACPACSELNVVSAVTCVRCGALMRPAAPAPAPLPAMAPLPAPVVEPEPEPESDNFWLWVSIAIGVAVASLIVLGLITLLG